MTKQIHTDDSARTPAARPLHKINAVLQIGEVHLECQWVNIHEHWHGAEQQRHLRRGGIGKGGQKDRIAAADSLRHQGNLQSIGPGADTHAVRGATKCRQPCLKLLNFRAEYILPMRQHFVQAVFQPVAQAFLLGFESKTRNRSKGMGVHGGQNTPLKASGREP